MNPRTPESIGVQIVMPLYSDAKRVSISITDADQPTSMAQVRGRISERLEGDQAWEIIDRASHKYTGQPYPLRTDRVVFLIEAEHAFARQFG